MLFYAGARLQMFRVPALVLAGCGQGGPVGYRIVPGSAIKTGCIGGCGPIFIALIKEENF
jgi:hypothetical protein